MCHMHITMIRDGIIGTVLGGKIGPARLLKLQVAHLVPTLAMPPESHYIKTLCFVRVAMDVSVAAVALYHMKSVLQIMYTLNSS